MKYIKLTTFIFGFLLFGCNQPDTKTTPVKEEKAASLKDDEEQIRNLVRQALNWSNSKKSFYLLPVLTDSKDSSYIGFDLNKHKENLDKLKATGFFQTNLLITTIKLF